MPNRDDIQREIIQLKNSAQDSLRRNYLASLNKYTKRDTILYASAFAIGKGPGIPPHVLSVGLDDIQGFMATLHGLKGTELDLILHSPGGSLEAAEQIVNYLRSKYTKIRAIIPQNAMSAATMIACACDEIWMGKQSAIGPVDPQITFPTQHGPFTAPAQSLLDDFEQAKQETAANPGVAPLWVAKMRDYPPGLFSVCSNTIQLAKEKVKTWLATYMFAGDPSADQKASDISEWLGNFSNHRTHGHPINFAEAQAKGLKVFLIESDQTLQERALSVFHATACTFMVSNTVKIIENHKGKGLYFNVDSK